MMESKKIFWTFKQKQFEGFANLCEKEIILCNKDGAIFSTLPEWKLSKGETLKSVFDVIPSDITNFKLRPK